MILFIKQIEGFSGLKNVRTTVNKSILFLLFWLTDYIIITTGTILLEA